jgi:mono/diheme cytochrome c family protein
VPPRILIFAASLLALFATLPFAAVAWVRSAPSPNRPIHLVQDMDYQPKFLAQEANALFADDRSMRPAIEGVVAFGDAGDNVHLTDGVVDGAWATTTPSEMPITRALLERGQQRFNIYCSICHGYAGYGDGIVNQLALEAMANADGPISGTAWVQAKSMHDPTVRDQPIAQIFNTITHGVRNMASYSAQIPVSDRWAIAAYVKTLQMSQDAKLQDVPPAQRASLSQ